MSASKAGPAAIDEYLANLSEDKRAALEGLRKAIRAAAPGVQEGISYQIPGFRLDGKWLLWIGATARHCAIYGVTGAAVDGLESYDTSGKGTIRFHPDKPLPASLVRKLVKAQIAARKSAPNKVANGAAS